MDKRAMCEKFGRIKEMPGESMRRMGGEARWGF